MLDKLYDWSNLLFMKKNDVKEHVLSVGMDLIALNGFNATGIDAILKEAGVPKGSFYHYFGTKEKFGLEIIDKFSAEYARKLDSFLADVTVPPLRRIYNYLEHSISFLGENKFSKGCLIGNLGQELADQNEHFRLRLAEVFYSWQGKFSACFQEAMDAGQLDSVVSADALAQFFLSSWEGAILRAKVTRSDEPLKNFLDVFSQGVLRARD